jgi:uncharacterized protein (TIGR00369 family)
MNNPPDDKKFLPISRTCFVCGEDNAAGLGVRFYIEDETVKVRWRARDQHCGYDKVVHGGVTAAVLDECMGWAAARAIGRMCLTAELTVRYLRPIPCNRELTVSTNVTRAARRLAEVEATLADDEGIEYARAQGKFLPLSVEDTLAVDDALLYRGDDARLFDSLRTERTAQSPGVSYCLDTHD